MTRPLSLGVSLMVLHLIERVPVVRISPVLLIISRAEVMP